MDNFTESFNPYHKYENFECYVKLNMEYLKTTDGQAQRAILIKKSNRTLINF